MRITYDEYDKIEDICTKIYQDNETEQIGTADYFLALHNWPTVEQLEAVDVAHNMEQYFPYLMFWYTQRFDSQLESDYAEYEEYKKSMKYIQDLMTNQLEFVDA